MTFAERVKKKVYNKAKNCAKFNETRALRHGVPTEDLTDFIYNLLLTHHKCHYCGKILWYPEDKTIDHKLAMGLGGSNTRENIVIACNDCNHMKAVKEYELWRIKQLSTVI